MTKKIVNSLVWILTFYYLSAVPCQAQTEEWLGQWISVMHNQSEPNTWTAYRKNVTVENVPKNAIAKIAVDSKYWLWVNGTLVVFEGALKRGPNPADTYYDEVDIGPFLKKGNNTIAVLVWYFGKQGFSHNSSGKSGLFFQCISPQLKILSDATWMVRVHPSYVSSPPPYPNFRLPESNIFFDARNDLGEWFVPGYEINGKGFGAPILMGIPPIAPWGNLVKRPISQWKDFGMKNYISQKIKHGPQGDTIVCELPYNAQITPYLKVKASSGKLIDIRTDAYEGGSAYNVRAGYITRDGEQEYESFGWLSGNRVLYNIPNGVEVLSLQYRETGYATEFTGSFECDDPFMNLYWQKALRTLYITMRDSYMDCPDRERAQWIGDMVNEAGEAFYALDINSHALQKKSLLEMVGWQRSDGTMYAPIPSGNWSSELPSQVLASVGYYSYWYYYLYTGDKHTLKDVYDGVKKYLNVWEINDRGTVVFRKGGWTWGDWGDNIDTVLLENAWYYLALKGMQKVATELNKTEDASLYDKAMRDLKEAFNRDFWNGKVYRSYNYQYETDDRAQALAVVSGIAEADKYPALFELFKTQEHASPYMEKYVEEALFIMGEPEYAIQRMKKRFGPMVNNPDYTTLFEGWGIGEEGFGGGTFNHAWSGGGLTLMSQYVAGIAPIDPGFATFRVRPQMGNLKKVKANVTTVKGDISVSIIKDRSGMKMELTVPPGTVCKVEFPGTYKTVLENGKKVNVNKFGKNKVVTVTSGKYNFTAK